MSRSRVAPIKTLSRLELLVAVANAGIVEICWRDFTKQDGLFRLLGKYHGSTSLDPRTEFLLEANRSKPSSRNTVNMRP